MDADDPEKRIAELERQLAQQKRIAELERQLAEAKATANQNHAEGQPPRFSAAQADAAQCADDRARRYAESLWEGLRSGGPAAPGGPSEGEMAQHREAFKRAAAQAGLSQDQIDNIFKHGKATFKAGHSVVYSGQGAAPDDGAIPGITRQYGFSSEVGPRRQAEFGRRGSRGKLRGADRVGAIIGILGVCVGSGAALTAMFPSSALWMSSIVCSSPYHLVYNTSHSSYAPGQSGTSVRFQCVSNADWYNPSWLAIDGLQSLMVTLVVGGAVVVGRMLWKRLRRPA